MTQGRAGPFPSWPPSVLDGASRLGLGMAALGRPAYITLGRAMDVGTDRSAPALLARAREVLDAAYEGGIRYVDAARSYGAAEHFVAEWLRDRGHRVGDVAVGSKWGYTYVGAWRTDAERHEVQDLGVAAFRRQLAETREQLGSHLALYQIHSATIESGVLKDSEVLSALGDLRASGTAVGLTTTGPRQSETIDRAVQLGCFDAVQSTWNLLEPSSGASLARAHEAGMTVIVKEALANGRLTSHGDQPMLLQAAATHEVEPDTLAMAGALANPWADLVLSGAVTVAHLQSHLAAERLGADTELNVPDLAGPPGRYWRERASLPWS